jgi:uncharacterized protein (DUF433 family)
MRKAEESEDGMATEVLNDRGRGPEIAGTRITVYNLLPYLLDATATEEYIGRVLDLTSEQVAAARAYVLNNPEIVLSEHLKIEARMTAGNPPEVVERAKQTHATFLSFKEWLADREEAATEGRRSDSGQFPTFREWLDQRESRAAEGP